MNDRVQYSTIIANVAVPNSDYLAIRVNLFEEPVSE